jgi:heme/copper-type cytochrome/quinol oxidase subunit 2
VRRVGLNKSSIHPQQPMKDKNNMKSNQKGEITLLALSIIAVLVMGTMTIESLTTEETDVIIQSINENNLGHH